MLEGQLQVLEDKEAGYELESQREIKGRIRITVKRVEALAKET